MNLYEVSARYQQLLDQDEYTDDELQELQLKFDSLETSCVERAKYIRNIEAERQAVFNEMQNMLARLGDLDKKSEKQRSSLISLMQVNKMTHIKSPFFELLVKQNPVYVDISDAEKIPKEYLVTSVPKPVIKPDKKAIKEAIESGKEVPGAKLERNSKLEIK